MLGGKEGTSIGTYSVYDNINCKAYAKYTSFYEFIQWWVLGKQNSNFKNIRKRNKYIFASSAKIIWLYEYVYCDT